MFRNGRKNNDLTFVPFEFAFYFTRVRERMGDMLFLESLISKRERLRRVARKKV